jgi:hypothetical protein
VWEDGVARPLLPDSIFYIFYTCTMDRRERLSYVDPTTTQRCNLGKNLGNRSVTVAAR